MVHPATTAFLSMLSWCSAALRLKLKRRLARMTFCRMSRALLVQVKGLSWRLRRAMQSSTVAINSGTPTNTPRRILWWCHCCVVQRPTPIVKARQTPTLPATIRRRRRAAAKPRPQVSFQNPPLCPFLRYAVDRRTSQQERCHQRRCGRRALAFLGGKVRLLRARSTALRANASDGSITRTAMFMSPSRTESSVQPAITVDTP